MKSGFISLAICFGVGAGLMPAQAQESGVQLFDTHCAICHAPAGGQEALGPGIDAMRQMTPEHILEVMETGVMKDQADERSRVQRHILAEFLSGKTFGSVPPDLIPVTAYCAADATALEVMPAGPGWNGWGADLRNTRFRTGEDAGLTAAEIPRLKLKWAFGYPRATSGGTQPVVVGDSLFVANAEGDVFALDAANGCIKWRFQAEASVRSALSIGSVGGNVMAFFGDQAANVYGLEAGTGALIWKMKIDDHPRAVITGAPALHEGRLYVPVSSREESQVSNPRYPCCQFRGSMSALDATDGKLLWKTYTIREEARPIGKNSTGTQLWGPSGVPIWVAPTIDSARGRLYVGTGNNYSVPATENSDAILAFDMESGEILWSSQVAEDDIWNSSCRRAGRDPFLCPDPEAPDTDFANSPVLAKVDGRDLLFAGNKLGLVYAFDPDDKGRILWQTSTGKGSTSGGIMWGIAVDDNTAYAANNYFNAADPAVTGGITALDLATGRKRWSVPALSCTGRERCKPSHAAAVTAIPGVIFAGTMDGRLRALSARDGSTLWEYDTARGFETVNGVKAYGGSMSNAGVTIAGGTVYVNSGYSHHGAIIPGNVLLAFTVEPD